MVSKVIFVIIGVAVLVVVAGVFLFPPPHPMEPDNQRVIAIKVQNMTTAGENVSEGHTYYSGEQIVDVQQLDLEPIDWSELKVYLTKKDSDQHIRIIPTYKSSDLQVTEPGDHIQFTIENDYWDRYFQQGDWVFFSVIDDDGTIWESANYFQL